MTPLRRRCYRRAAPSLGGLQHDFDEVGSGCREALSEAAVELVHVGDACAGHTRAFGEPDPGRVRRQNASPTCPGWQNTLRPALSNALILAATSSAVLAALRVKTISSLTARIAPNQTLRRQ